MRVRSGVPVLVISVVLAGSGLAGCAAEELPDDEWACPHFAAITEKLSFNYLDPSADAQTKWDEARASLDDTEEMAGNDLKDLVSEAQDALPASPLGDVAEFDRVAAEIDSVCTLPDGFPIIQLEASR